MAKKKKKNEGAGTARSEGRKGLPFILQLPIFLIVALITAVFWLFEKLLDLGRNDSDAETPPDDAKFLPELKRLAEVLARGDPAALEIVMLAAEDQRAFVKNDSYGFAVVSTEDFERIRDIDNRRFAVRADFGPDQSYESARRILAAHPPVS